MDEKFLKLLREESAHCQSLLYKQIAGFWQKSNLKTLTGVSQVELISKDIDRALVSPAAEFYAVKGKNLRPVFGLLLLKAWGKRPDMLRKYFILPELLHSASLIFDDIEDGASIRRGKPALYKKIGLDIAVNLAGALYFIPFEIMKNSKSRYKQEINNILLEALHRMHIGQGLDILWHKDNTCDISISHYNKMVKLKTSSFFRAEAQLAALFAGVKKAQCEKAECWAEKIGCAFQIMDDVLDLSLGKEGIEKFGKTFGQDITEGKRTLILIYALQKATFKDKKRIKEILSLKSKKTSIIIEAIDIFNKYDAIEYAKAIALKHIHVLADEIAVTLPKSRARTSLLQYCDFIIERKI